MDNFESEGSADSFATKCRAYVHSLHLTYPVSELSERNAPSDIRVLVGQEYASVRLRVFSGETSNFLVEALKGKIKTQRRSIFDE